MNRVGEYELLSELGRGGMGTVFLARRPSHDRLVALKVLGVDSPELARRLRREQAALAELQHPHIVTLLDVGEHQGRPFYVMPHFPGGSLGHVLRRDGWLEPGQAAGVLAVLAEALAAMHDRGLLHRDVKPSNVLLTSAGDPYLADFGLVLSGEEEQATTSGVVLGTVAYTAPEVTDGAPASPESDTYALGVMGYQLLAGRLPFSGPTISSIIRSADRGEKDPLAEAAPEVPEELARLVEDAMARDPHARPSRLRLFAADLRAAVNFVPLVPAPPPTAAVGDLTGSMTRAVGVRPELEAEEDPVAQGHRVRLLQRSGVVVAAVVGALLLGAGGTAALRLADRRSPEPGNVPAPAPMPSPFTPPAPEAISPPAPSPSAPPAPVAISPPAPPAPLSPSASAAPVPATTDEPEANPSPTGEGASGSADSDSSADRTNDDDSRPAEEVGGQERTREVESSGESESPSEGSEPPRPAIDAGVEAPDEVESADPFGGGRGRGRGGDAGDDEGGGSED